MCPINLEGKVVSDVKSRKNEYRNTFSFVSVGFFGCGCRMSRKRRTSRYKGAYECDLACEFVLISGLSQFNYHD